MAKIVLISCASKKLTHKSKARDLYVSPLFKKALEYAELLKPKPNKIFILSAEHGLLDLDKEIEPYDKTLNKMSSDEIRKWADSVLTQLRKESDLDKDIFVFLAGKKYREFLRHHIKNKEIPMRGLRIGKQLQWLTRRIKHE